MLWVLLALACAAAVLLAVVLVRAALFKPGEGKNTPGEAAGIEYKRAVEHLSQMVRVPTVSSRNPQEVDEGAFEDFRRLLETLYPRVTATCPRERIGPSGLLYYWKGNSPARLPF